jgi:hypothetical protein
LSKSIFKSLTIILLLAGNSQCLLAGGQREGKQSPTHEGSSGLYDSLLIGVDKEKGELTGFYEDGTGWDEQLKAPKFSCIFYIYGKLQGDAYQITTWYPGEDKYIKGELKFVLREGRKEIDVKLVEEHGGCWNVQPFAEKGRPATMSLTEHGDWIGVKVVSANKAFFHNGPDAQMKGRSYVVKNDPVRVLKIQPGWVEAEYGGKKTVRGWIKESDLFSSHPNAK